MQFFAPMMKICKNLYQSLQFYKHNQIYNHNKLQKFYADLINTICNNVIKKYNYRENEYLFNF